MAIVVETGSGQNPLAVSYASPDGASLYFGSSLNAEDWIDVDLIDQEHALVTASRMLDDMIAWKGTQAFADQPMGWPRKGVRDPSGTMFPYHSVPRAVRNATAALGLYLISNPHFVTFSTIPQATGTTDTEGLKKIKLGSLEVEYQAKAGSAGETTPALTLPFRITAMLHHWGIYTSKSAVMGRVIR